MSPERAIVKKELRSLRGLILLAVGLALASPLLAGAWLGSGLAGPGRIDYVPALVIMLAFYVVLPLFAAAFGASPFAGERAERTLSFLMSRPVTRIRVFFAKVGAALGAWLFCIVAWIVVAQVLASLDGRRELIAELGFYLGTGWPMWIIASLVVFSCAIFASTWLGQTMTAAAGGLAAAVLTGGVVYRLWFTSTGGVGWAQEWLALQWVALAVLMIAAAAVTFAWDELRGRWRSAAGLTLAALTVLALGTISILPLRSAMTGLDSTRARLSFPALVPSEGVVVSWVADFGVTPTGLGTWSIPIDGRPAKQISDRFTQPYYVESRERDVPGGRVFVLSARHYFRFLERETSPLYQCDLDGSGMRRVPTDLRFGEGEKVEYIPAGHAISPDGRWMVFDSTTSQRIRFVRLRSDAGENNDEHVVDIGGSRRSVSGVVAWTPESRVLYLSEDNEIHSIDPDSGDRRVLYGTENRLLPLIPTIHEQPGDHGLVRGGLIFVEKESGRDGSILRLRLIDPVTGNAETLIDDACGVRAGIGLDPERIAVTTCVPGRREVGDPVQLALFDLETRERTPIAVLPDRPTFLALSPDARHVAVRVGLDTFVYRVEDGSREPVGRAAWVAWADRRRLVVGMGGAAHEIGELRVLDLETGDSRTVFP